MVLLRCHLRIERYDQGTKTLWAWVKLTVDHDDDTPFYIHYDETEAISPDPAANVWTNYVAVNHLKDTVDGNTPSTRDIVGSAGNIIAGGRTDSWDSKNMWESHASSGQETGKIGYGLEFAGTEHGGK